MSVIIQRLSRKIANIKETSGKLTFAEGFYNFHRSNHIVPNIEFDLDDEPHKDHIMIKKYYFRIFLDNGENLKGLKQINKWLKKNNYTELFEKQLEDKFWEIEEEILKEL